MLIRVYTPTAGTPSNWFWRIKVDNRQFDVPREQEYIEFDVTGRGHRIHGNCEPWPTSVSSIRPAP